MYPSLDWLPKAEDFRASLKHLRNLEPNAVWVQAVALAGHDLDFIQTNALDHVIRSKLGADTLVAEGVPTIRLAVLGSSTVTHLLPGIRVAGLRRNLRIIVYEADYGQYRQELLDPGSSLYHFLPDTVLFALDAYHLAARISPAMDAEEAEQALMAAVEDLTGLWNIARERLGATTILHQTALPVLPELIGNNEERLPGSPCLFIESLNSRLRDHALRTTGVHMIAVDRRARREGLATWHDQALWYRSKQEIALHAMPVYGELVVRVIAALAGRSAKCLVLDLDNTIWGGTIGDDGIDGIVLGQGSATGEAFVALQSYASQLSERGVILAVCSKNDEAVAMAGFADHPEMVLRPSQIASFVANWSDKAGNLRRIASELNIGLDSLVFVDDNPFERELVRRELPMVAVPELPEDPALVTQRLVDAAYFESVILTNDDRARTRQYQSNRTRAELQADATDLPSYLRGLEMRLQWSRLDTVGLQRAVQLINKTNQFNLTTRRYTEEAIRTLIDDADAFGLQFRLVDRLSDNGIIAIVIGRRNSDDIAIDTWLMSCRVLGRQVEQATLSVIAQEAVRLGATGLIGEYIPSAKNDMVREHYARIGFLRIDATDRWKLSLAQPVATSQLMAVEEA